VEGKVLGLLDDPVNAVLFIMALMPLMKRRDKKVIEYIIVLLLSAWLLSEAGFRFIQMKMLIQLFLVITVYFLMKSVIK
jgi:glucose dehydrogenase